VYSPEYIDGVYEVSEKLIFCEKSANKFAVFDDGKENYFVPCCPLHSCLDDETAVKVDPMFAFKIECKCKDLNKTDSIQLTRRYSRQTQSAFPSQQGNAMLRCFTGHNVTQMEDRIFSRRTVFSFSSVFQFSIVSVSALVCGLLYMCIFAFFV